MRCVARYLMYSSTHRHRAPCASEPAFKGEEPDAPRCAGPMYSSRPKARTAHIAPARLAHQNLLFRGPRGLMRGGAGSWWAGWPAFRSAGLSVVVLPAFRHRSGRFRPRKQRIWTRNAICTQFFSQSKSSWDKLPGRWRGRLRVSSSAPTICVQIGLLIQRGALAGIFSLTRPGLFVCLAWPACLAGLIQRSACPRHSTCPRWPLPTASAVAEALSCCQSVEYERQICRKSVDYRRQKLE